MPVNIDFVTSGGFNNISDYRSNFLLDDDVRYLLQSHHEEADTRILLHALSAKKTGYTRCIIDCKDTNVLVLLAHFKEYLTPEVWIKVGNKDTSRLIAVHDINMNPRLLKNLPAFHALTGCDTTSQFSGIGKKSCWKTYLLYCSLLDGVGSKQFDEDLFKKMNEFVIKLYTSNPDVSSLDDLRGLQAVSKTIDKLPPTTDSLRQHCLRVFYQTKIWLNSLNPNPVLPDFSDYGWKVENGQVVPVLQLQQAFPKEVAILTTCGCKKGKFRF